VLPLRRLVVASVLLGSLHLAPAAEKTKPKLVVAIIIDQFRYDYLTRFRTDYHSGIDQLLTHGADFTSAYYGQVPTVTAVGHSIFLSGAMPAVSGIIGNSWYDRDSHQEVTSVCDWTRQIVGAPQPEKKSACTDDDPASPARLLVTTLGDELRLAHPNAKVIGISRKARAAILPSGHAANGAFWFDDGTGNFVTSTFYMNQLPKWVEAFNARKLPEKYVDRPWPGFPNWKFRAAPGSKSPFSKLDASPWSNELIEALAEQAITGEQLGQRDETDLLTVSFSANDAIGHAVGPYAPEVKDMAIRTDQLIGKLFALIDQKIGMQNVIVVLSADHGVAPTPQQNGADKIPAGYLPSGIDETVENALNERFGKQQWLVPGGEGALYFDDNALQASKAHPEEVFAVAAHALLANPQLHIVRVYSRTQLEDGVAGDFIAQAEMNGFFPRRSPDLNLVFDPGYMPGKHGTSHFSPYNYDRHVPAVFMGPGIKTGRYPVAIRPNDIAPTLADLLDLQAPSGSSGRVLSEMYE